MRQIAIYGKGGIFGLSMEKSGEILKQTHEIPHFNFPSYPP